MATNGITNSFNRLQEIKLFRKQLECLKISTTMDFVEPVENITNGPAATILLKM